MYVSQPTVNAITELIGALQTGNRILDRCQSVINAKFAYPVTAKYVHKMAHYLPATFDKLGEKCLERYNIPVYYPSTPAGGQDYDNVVDAILDVEKTIVDIQTMFIGCCKIAQQNDDFHVYADLLDILEDYNEAVEQAILLGDKIRLYGEKPNFDSNITKWWTWTPDD